MPTRSCSATEITTSCGMMTSRWGSLNYPQIMGTIRSCLTFLATVPQGWDVLSFLQKCCKFGTHQVLVS